MKYLFEKRKVDWDTYTPKAGDLLRHDRTPASVNIVISVSEKCDYAGSKVVYVRSVRYATIDFHGQLHIKVGKRSKNIRYYKFNDWRPVVICKYEPIHDIEDRLHVVSILKDVDTAYRPLFETADDNV